MKVLDVQNLHSGIDELIKKVGNQKKDIQDVGAAVHSFAALEDSFNGKGGKAIRSFYEECHSPFLLFYQQFLASYEQILKQIKSSLQSLEPLDSGYIQESFLLNNLEEGLQQTKKMTALLTEEANDTIRSVQDIIPLSTLQADDFLEDIYQAQKYRNTTMEKLYAFDKQQAFILSETTHDLYQMRKYIQDIQSQFQSGAWSITGYEAGQLSESGITFVAAAEKPNVTAPASEEILACEAPVAEEEKVDDLNNFLLEGKSLLLDILPGILPGISGMKTLIEVITGKDLITEEDIKLTKGQRSLILDFVPFISNVKAAIETITEKDFITEKELTTAEWVIGGASILAGPIGKAGKWIFKGGSELVANIPKYADTIAEQFKKVQHVLNPENIKSVMDDAYKQATKLVRGIPGKVQEMKQSILDSLPSIAPDVVMDGGGAVGRIGGDVVEEAKEQIYTFAKNIKNEAKATVNEVKSLFGGNKGTVKDKPNTKRKPIQPREFKKRAVNEDGTITYNLVSKKNGKEYKVTYDRDGYPVFSSKHQSELPKFLYLKSDSRQFRHLTKELAQKIEEKPELGKKFTEKELKLIKKGKVPKSLTWHHHQDAGKMQLVDYYEHEVAKHTGGRSLWGGGRKGREGKL
ncbi:T7SS effector LXG polymorphic toxin [Metabacillus fastidiosus]|uniref:T7SS effector LXG polymorphic toxin n=1 Tax=Metabacillus fastidiosus TaxID=1458 RepID=A0ABU6NX28_9BACI|nr:T7SS effector LXG polymorphic toxin [Metabacillus fastidiosus]